VRQRLLLKGAKRACNSIHLRQFEIEQHHVGRKFIDRAHQLNPVARTADFIAQLAQQHGQRLRAVKIVLYPFDGVLVGPYRTTGNCATVWRLV
jgi:hypothetical protein